MRYERLPQLAIMTERQQKALSEARVAFMRACPFFAYYYYDQMVEYPTLEMSTAATDGRRIFYNPAYMAKLKVAERVFVLAHEVYHTIWRHPLRMRNYRRNNNMLRKLPYIHDLYNIAADYVINHVLVSTGIGQCNKNWLYDPAIHGNQLVEDVYEQLYKKLPPPPPPPPPRGGDKPGDQKGKGGKGDQPGKPGGKPGNSGNNSPTPTVGKPSPSQYGTFKPGGSEDDDAEDGQFDVVLEPFTDPATGKEDIPGDNEFKEAVARAAAAAKAVGNLPGAFKSMIDEIMEPQVQWKEHIRMAITGKIGERRETWATPDRRRIALGAPYPARPPMIYLPGKTKHGANLVTVVVDTSGSIGERELSAFFAELSAILGDCKPREVMVIWCDAMIQRIDEARSLDELAEIRVKGAPGRGGTDFRPPFKHLADKDIVPDTLVYLTDLYGPFPDEAPKYPVIWCATTNKKGPFGETVRIEV